MPETALRCMWSVAQSLQAGIAESMALVVLFSWSIFRASFLALWGVSRRRARGVGAELLLGYRTVR